MGSNLANDPMTTNDETITKFYTAFQQKDYVTIGALCHPEATFRDAVFDLRSGKEAAAMWEMLLTTGKDLRVEFSDAKVNGNRASAHWEAYYTFSKTGHYLQLNF
jgi:SnoaL-like domain